MHCARRYQSPATKAKHVCDSNCDARVWRPESSCFVCCVSGRILSKGNRFLSCVEKWISVAFNFPAQILFRYLLPQRALIVNVTRWRRVTMKTRSTKTVQLMKVSTLRPVCTPAPGKSEVGEPPHLAIFISHSIRASSLQRIAHL